MTFRYALQPNFNMIKLGNILFVGFVFFCGLFTCQGLDSHSNLLIGLAVMSGLTAIFFAIHTKK